MLSRIAYKASSATTLMNKAMNKGLVQNQAKLFATSKKPSIGDAVTILQSKVSSINQVVSRFKITACLFNYDLIV